MSAPDKHADLLRLDGRLYRVVGETTIEGEKHKVVAPIGRGPLRAVRADIVGNEEEQERDSNTQNEQKPAAPLTPATQQQRRQRQQRRYQTPAERLHLTLWPRPGYIGYVPIAVLVVILSTLAAMFD